ncbi:MAG TPA: CotH kinase family protein [Acetivibrio clariflavus]|mgnify:CR=1 FL=1|nr:CotH kinase family protein [Acetivibrio clariflavus]
MKKGRFLIFSLAFALVSTVFSNYTVNVSAGSLKGDVNSDNSIDSIDYAVMKSYLLGISSQIPFDVSVADLNGDGSVNSIDLALMKSYLLGIITSFPAETSNPTPTPTPTENKDDTDMAGDIIFSVPSGTFRDRITVSLSSKIPNAQIRYTTDGSVPNSNSPLYSGPLTFTKTTQLRAQSFVNGTASGAMGTAIYIATSIDAKHDIPVIILDAYGGGKPNREYKDVAFMLFEPKNNELSILQTPSVVSRAAFHIRGQSSANFEKTPYRLELRDNADEDAKLSLLGMPADGDWTLLSPYPDKSLIRNPLAYEIGNIMGLATPRYRHVEVYINFDNQPLSADDYQGVYLLTEKIEISKNRLNLKKLKKDDLQEPEISGGYLMQFNMMAAEEPIIRGNGWSDLELTEPDDATPEQLAWIANYIQQTHNAIHSSNPSDPNTGYPAYIDVDSFVDYIIVNEMAKEADSYIRSTRIYKDRNEKLKAGPLWDYDLGFGCIPGFGFGFGGGGTSSNTEGWQFEMMGMGNTTCDWFYTLMQDPSFQSKISARWSQLRQGPLSDTQLIALVDSLASPLSNAAKRNFQKWNILGTSMVGGFNTQTTQTWEEQITILKNFLTQRAAWLDQSGWKPLNTGGGWPGGGFPGGGFPGGGWPGDGGWPGGGFPGGGWPGDGGFPGGGWPGGGGWGW